MSREERVWGTPLSKVPEGESPKIGGKCKLASARQEKKCLGGIHVTRTLIETIRIPTGLGASIPESGGTEKPRRSSTMV